jgi:uncharacterized protein (UPF0276 family)
MNSSLTAGLGLRNKYIPEILDTRPQISWFEIISEEFLGYGGKERAQLLAIREYYPVVCHGVCMSVGSTDPLDEDYLRQLKELADELESPWVSDHLCFTMVDHQNLNELTPLPFTKDAVDNCVARIGRIQDILQRPFLVENVTRYLTLPEREMTEVEFIREILQRSGCGLLLDVTNVLINSRLHHFDPQEWMRGIPCERVRQFHLAGWVEKEDGDIIDGHDAPVPDSVWDLFAYTVALTGPKPVLIERDRKFPPLQELLAEAQDAERRMYEAVR